MGKWRDRGKGKEEYLYSTIYTLWISQSAQAWITVLPANTPCLGEGDCPRPTRGSRRRQPEKKPESGHLVTIWQKYLLRTFTNLAVLKYPATACSRKLKAAATYLKHGCRRVSNISILILLSCQPLRNSLRFDSLTYVHKQYTLGHCGIDSHFHNKLHIPTDKCTVNSEKTLKFTSGPFRFLSELFHFSRFHTEYFTE